MSSTMVQTLVHSLRGAMLLMLICFSAFAQSSQDLIKEGIACFDKGQYEQAINLYQQALALEPTSSLANYEISMTYQAIKDHKNALKYSEQALKLDANQMPAYLVKGSALDDLGRPKEAVMVFEKCLQKFGSHYLVHYNLALTLLRVADQQGAEKNLLKAIELQPSHASSHLMLANSMGSKGAKTQSMLGYYYFLLLEPATERSKEAYRSLLSVMKAGVKIDEQNPKHITITVDSKGGATDMMMALMQAAKTTEEVKEKNKNKTAGQLFIEDTEMFFEFSTSQKVKKKDRNLWNQLYAPLFKSLAQTDHMYAFCYYITQASSEESAKWLKDNPGKVDQFSLWLKNQ
ncbi:tetratricopeptide repeat protein [Rhodocytophaga aerolata]|uniref:Tetratricopeptide repeat protein n=1 Tax=Rhodocytophaga aerolata TaxID=455078 RepID=A0ABT8RII6_9BACT|nr:tetratricopeptide repeat protein [Rhodocytophaga aerolata]MDO1451789.1 tetratricopeptide repeat protein [Rhodocytophaga aerolata]